MQALQNHQAQCLDIPSLVKQASAKITPVWPIETFIACNPLQAYENQNFDETLQTQLQERLTATNQKEIERINQEMIKWSSAFLDLGQASIEMPHRRLGFYRNFLFLAQYDSSLHQGKKTWLKKLSLDPYQSIKQSLKTLNIAEDDYLAFIHQTLHFLPGWAGYVKWFSEWNLNSQLRQKTPIDLAQYLAVRLAITVIIWPQAKLLKKISDHSQQITQILKEIKQKETRYAKDLCQKIKPIFKQNQTRPPVQMVFCIDVRSEPFRRQIESLDQVETLGFAGFFGLAIRVHDKHQPKHKDCCPVLLQPRFDIQTTLQGPVAAYERGYEFIQSFKGAYQQLKYNFTTPFNLADGMGPWCGLGIMLKNFTPKAFSNVLGAIKEKIQPKVSTDLILEEDHQIGIPHEEQVAHAHLILRLMGLTQNFAKVVVFCGHKSTTTNNPYAASLDCGACGGNHGEYNAKLLAKILNQVSVRQALANKGIQIPADCIFIAGVHDTTTDACELFTAEKDMHCELIQQLKQKLILAQAANFKQRQADFLQSPVTPLEKSLNWAETRPEWGLARNAAFLVGPRSLSRDINLEGRCFLHSYDWQLDQDAKLLTIILTAPMVVAQWINSQYLFSTLDNINYGSGSKITHNVVGQLGIMQGNGSDLMHGLPLQSVKTTDDENFHPAQRLLCIVYAPKASVMQVIQENEILQNLFGHTWVLLRVLDPQDNLFYQFMPNFSWQKQDVI